MTGSSGADSEKDRISSLIVERQEIAVFPLQHRLHRPVDRDLLVVPSGLARQVVGSEDPVSDLGPDALGL